MSKQFEPGQTVWYVSSDYYEDGVDKDHRLFVVKEKQVVSGNDVRPRDVLNENVWLGVDGVAHVGICRKSADSCVFHSKTDAIKNAIERNEALVSDASILIGRLTEKLQTA